MGRFYKIHEFAELAGVTVKALRHYDRLGLLKPARTGAAYRMYAERDLERLEQIVALKFLGIPLKRIKTILDRPGLELPEILRMQRTALEQKQHLLCRAVRAIQAAEDAIHSGKPAHPAMLKRIIEVIDMQDDIKAMKKYYGTEEAWERHRRLYEEGPSSEWKQLYGDIGAALEEDPASDVAQNLADRWFKLSVRAYNGDPEVQVDSGTAWMDREHWPPSMKRRIAEFNLDKVHAFIKRAVSASQRKYFSEAALARLVEARKDAAAVSVRWQSRVDLFRAIEAALGEDTAGEKAHELARRWMAYIETASGGDPEVKAGLMKMWADRRNWTVQRRWFEEALSALSGERFDQAADFIDKAVAAVDNK